MFTLRLELMGGAREDMAPMTGEEVLATLSAGMFGRRPYACVVDGVEVPWAAFQTIFNLARYDDTF